MPYVIITERSKTERPDMSADIYYSHIHGCFSRRDEATLYTTFGAAQPRVRKLRNASHPFVYAVEVR